MKIIKKGKIPPPETYKGTCNFCKTEIECTNNEVKSGYDQRDGESWTTAKCPICSRELYVQKIRYR